MLVSGQRIIEHGGSEVPEPVHPDNRPGKPRKDRAPTRLRRTADVRDARIAGACGAWRSRRCVLFLATMFHRRSLYRRGDGLDYTPQLSL